MTDPSSIQGGAAPNLTVREKYERWFRENREQAIYCGFDLCCVICGIAFDDTADNWDDNHDGSLHRVYDQLQAEAKP